MNSSFGVYDAGKEIEKHRDNNIPSNDSIQTNPPNAIDIPKTSPSTTARSSKTTPTSPPSEITTHVLKTVPLSRHVHLHLLPNLQQRRPAASENEPRPSPHMPFLSLPFFVTLQLASSPPQARSPTSPATAARIPVRERPASPTARDLDRSLPRPELRLVL